MNGKRTDNATMGRKSTQGVTIRFEPGNYQTSQGQGYGANASGGAAAVGGGTPFAF